MPSSPLKFLVPAGLAIVLLVMLRAQNQNADPAAVPTPEPATAPTTIIQPASESDARTKRRRLSLPPAVSTAENPAPPVDQPTEPSTEPAVVPINPAENVNPTSMDLNPPIVPPPPIENPATAYSETKEPSNAARAKRNHVPKQTRPNNNKRSRPSPPPVSTGTINPIENRMPTADNSYAANQAYSTGNTSSYDDETPRWEFTESAMDISAILDKYEEITGRHTIRDGQVQGQLPLKVNGRLSTRQAVDYLKALLLLNNISIVPSDIKNTDKVLLLGQRLPNIEQSKEVRPIYTDPRDLPLTEQVITYVMYMKYISAEEAQRSLQQVITGAHAYAKLIPVPQAGAIIIIDNVPTVRMAIALQEKIDVPPTSIVKKFFQLERADAEDVASVITDILAAQAKLKNPNGSTGGGRSVSVNNAAQQLANAGLPPGAIPGIPGDFTGGGGERGGSITPPDDSSVVVKAITRTNEVLVSGQTKDIKYVEDLIRELDKEAKVKNLRPFRLRFIRVEDFLAVAQDAIQRGQENVGGSSGGSGGSNRTPGGTGPVRNTGTGFQGSDGSGFVNNGFGGSSGFGNSNRFSRSGGSFGRGGISRGRSSSTGGNTANLTPTSQVVGKTLLISEPRSNTLLVAGPPEHITRIEEVIAQMDKRPLQVSISAVIAEVTLNDERQRGFDIFRTAERVRIGGQDINFATGFSSAGGTGIIDPNALRSIAGAVSGGTGNNNSAVQQALGAGGLNTWASMGELFNLYIQALESHDKVKIISRPFVFTSNNKQASISIGRRQPVPASTQNFGNNNGGFNTSIEYEEANLELNVTPLINSKDEITLTVSQVNDNVLNPIEIAPGVVAPPISQQSIDAEVTIPNGGVAVVGGLMREADNTSGTKAPWLGRIPVIREFVGSKNSSKGRSELLIFLHPQIVETSDELIDMQVDHTRRTVVGSDAMKFAKPEYNVDDVIIPSEEGDLPVDSSNDHVIETKAESTRELKNSSRSAKNEPESLYHTKTPDREDERKAFWEKPDPKDKEKSKKAKGLNKALPWNWGKKEE